MVAWLKSADVDAAEFLPQIDDQFLWPLVKLNFDCERCYTIKHRPVIETFTKNLGGGEEGRGEAGQGKPPQQNGQANGFSPFRSSAGASRFGGGPIQMSDDDDDPPSEEMLQLATVHAPEGGITINGTFYEGGQFIPGKELAHATKAQKKLLDVQVKDKTTGGTKALPRGSMHHQLYIKYAINLALTGSKHGRLASPEMLDKAQDIARGAAGEVVHDVMDKKKPERKKKTKAPERSYSDKVNGILEKYRKTAAANKLPVEYLAYLDHVGGENNENHLPSIGKLVQYRDESESRSKFTHRNTMRAITRATERLCAEYPVVRSALSTGRIYLGMPPNTPSTWAGCCAMMGYGSTISIRAHTDVITHALSKRTGAEYATKKSPVKTGQWTVWNGAEGTLVHEVGHAVDAALPQSARLEFRDAIQQDYGDDVTRTRNIKQKISEYGSKNLLETFAESFSVYVAVDYARGTLGEATEAWFDKHIQKKKPSDEDLAAYAEYLEKFA